MTAKDLINYMVPPLKPNDTISKAKQWLEELRIAELPIAEKGRFIGILNEELIYNENQSGEVISDFQVDGGDCIVYEGQHYYDVLRVAYVKGYRIVGVLDEKNNYLGVITIEDVIEAFAQTSSISSPGAILTISMNFRDYFLSEISRLIESNEGRILSCYQIPDPEDPMKVLVTIKINQEETSQIKTLLESGGYNVVQSFNDKAMSFHEKDRFDHLMNFLKL